MFIFEETCYFDKQFTTLHERILSYRSLYECTDSSKLVRLTGPNRMINRSIEKQITHCFKSYLCEFDRRELDLSGSKCRLGLTAAYRKRVESPGDSCSLPHYSTISPHLRSLFIDRTLCTTLLREQRSEQSFSHNDEFLSVTWARRIFKGVKVCRKVHVL